MFGPTDRGHDRAIRINAVARLGGCRHRRRRDGRRVQLGVRGLHVSQPTTPGRGHQNREVHTGKLCHPRRRRISR